MYISNVQLHTSSSVAAGVITPMVCFYFSAVSSTSQQTDSPEIPIQIQDRIHLMCPTQNRKWLKASLGNIKITGRQCAGGQMVLKVVGRCGRLGLYLQMVGCSRQLVCGRKVVGGSQVIKGKSKLLKVDCRFLIEGGGSAREKVE